MTDFVLFISVGNLLLTHECHYLFQGWLSSTMAQILARITIQQFQISVLSPVVSARAQTSPDLSIPDLRGAGKKKVTEQCVTYNVPFIILNCINGIGNNVKRILCPRFLRRRWRMLRWRQFLRWRRRSEYAGTMRKWLIVSVIWCTTSVERSKPHT